MTAIESADQSHIDAAWEEYAAIERARQQSNDHLLSRQHAEDAIRAYSRFRDLFLEAMN